MAQKLEHESALRGVRDVLREQLATLDRLGESEAAIEVNAGIEILNGKLGETPSLDEIERLQRRFLSD